MMGTGEGEGRLDLGGGPASPPGSSPPLPPAPTTSSPAPSPPPNPTFAPRSAAEAGDAIRAAASAGQTLRIQGGASWLHGGRPVHADALLDLSALRGIVEYVPGDLTLTAGAATTLAEIRDATAINGQWLPLDAPGDARTTLGAVLATALSGPMGSTIGAPRDVALGVEFIDGTGALVCGGGRVVKNVAGFDLVRLAVGAWGTIGAITQATVRLRARPEGECSYALPLPDRPEELATLLRSLRAAPITPLAVELLDAATARWLGVAGDAVALIRVTGNAASLAYQRTVLASMAPLRDVGDDVWSRWATAEPGDTWTLRISRRPSELPRLWHDIQHMAGQIGDARAHASVERGVVRLIVAPVAHGSSAGGSGNTEPERAAHLARAVSTLAASHTVIGEHLPAQGWGALPSAVGDALSGGVLRAFDPARILNRGILGDVA